MPDQSAAAVAEPSMDTVRETAERQHSKPKRQPRYNVILWNDNDHTYEYVIAMLQELFGHPPEKGFLMAREVDTRGRVIVLTTTKEHAELKRDQIHAYGKDVFIPTCKGSMSATIEPVPGE
ncbi:MAG: ATP-dependent Clp protease adaptor ClpS [Pirellulales bacterium]|nr:ATP-dependent Clp protease adaptor ClpS [Pirellulales bacterium]